jgi:glycosyltransferase involved in cell wall biosynthesis
MPTNFATDLIQPPRICIISPALPPKLDGIGDYTALLSRQLVSLGISPTILTDEQVESDAIDGVRILRTFDPDLPGTNWKLVESISAANPDWILVQYNPFGFGRRGLNLHLYRVLARLKQVLPATRLAVMFHETYVPPVNVRMAVMAVWQRWQFRRIGRAADLMFFSIYPWAEEHRSWFPGKPIYHLPVGSNIPRIEISKHQARLDLGLEADEVVLGVFGNAHTSRLFNRVRQSAEALQNAGRRVRVLYIGPDGGKLTSEIGRIPLIADGPLPADQVSRRLSAVDISLATYSDGVSTRRGAMMAALQHGLPIVGTMGIHTDPELMDANGHALLLAPAGDAEAFCKAVVSLSANPKLQAALSTGALELFDQRYSWGAIALNLVRQFEAAGAVMQI